jgi:hypothetical protein
MFASGITGIPNLVSVESANSGNLGTHPIILSVKLSFD